MKVLESACYRAACGWLAHLFCSCVARLHTDCALPLERVLRPPLHRWRSMSKERSTSLTLCDIGLLRYLAAASLMAINTAQQTGL